MKRLILSLAVLMAIPAVHAYHHYTTYNNGCNGCVNADPCCKYATGNTAARVSAYYGGNGYYHNGYNACC